MRQFKNILIVVNDGAQPEATQALVQGASLAEKSNARLTLMDVIASPEGNFREYKGIAKPEEILEMMVKQRKKELEDMANRVATGLEIEVVVVAGRDFIEIIRQVIFNKQDLLIKVANDYTGNFDSSDFHLMRKCPQPVWLLKVEKRHRSGRVLATIDLALESHNEGREMNFRILELACSLARHEDKEVHALSCWSLYGENTLRNSGFLRVSDEQIAKTMQQEEQANKKLQSALLSQFSSDDVKGHLIKGHPVDHIPAFTEENEIDVVVMGTVARTGIPGLLIGNTSETILHLIDSSVITLKPKGFESIIK